MNPEEIQVEEYVWRDTFQSFGNFNKNSNSKEYGIDDTCWMLLI